MDQLDHVAPKPRTVEKVPAAKAKKPTVFYDGACPLCQREIAFYKRYAGADGIAWVDVSGSPPGEIAPGLTRDRALARFHVLDGGGTLKSGGAAFAELWAALPGFRPLGMVLRTRPFAWVLNLAYDLFLRVRPRLQALARRRQDAVAGGMPAWLLRDLRSDHAGETGAVAIYRGILAFSRNAEVRRFAEAHLETERRHLALIETVLAPKARSALLPLWRLAGFVTGALPALFGPKAVFATIAAVETFVDRHYAKQVERLRRGGTNGELCGLLERCRLDEVRHRDDAGAALDGPPGVAARAWCWMVAVGSAAAVTAARRF